MSRLIMTFADGFETVEALMSVDVLRRGGVKVTTASITDDKIVTSSHGVPIVTDVLLSDTDVKDYDAIMLPGGMPGTTNLLNSPLIRDALEIMRQDEKIISAICAAPTVLGEYGYLKGKKACCYPGLEDKLTGAIVTKDAVTKDGNIITSRGLGTAMEFAFLLLSELEGEDVTDKIKDAIVYQG